MAHVEARSVQVHGATVEVRTASEDDAEAMLAHRRRMAGTSPYLLIEASDIDPDLSKQRAWIADHLEQHGRLALVAVSDAGVIGQLSFRAGERRRIAHQGRFGIGVEPGWRSRGVGRALIETLLDWAAAHPVIEKVGLGVFEAKNSARRLYERLGFVEESRQVRFVKDGDGEYIDDVLMCIFVKPGAPDGFKVWQRRL